MNSTNGGIAGPNPVARPKSCILESAVGGLRKNTLHGEGDCRFKSSLIAQSVSGSNRAKEKVKMEEFEIKDSPLLNLSIAFREVSKAMSYGRRYDAWLTSGMWLSIGKSTYEDPDLKACRREMAKLGYRITRKQARNYVLRGGR